MQTKVYTRDSALAEMLNPLGRCSVCNRCCFRDADIGKPCKMIQPNGSRCAGVFAKTRERSNP